jgi:hypothetical protein
MLTSYINPAIPAIARLPIAALGLSEPRRGRKLRRDIVQTPGRWLEHADLLAGTDRLSAAVLDLLDDPG